jgi:Protein of unknown function (DUF4231)
MSKTIEKMRNTSGIHNQQWLLGRRLLALEHWPWPPKEATDQELEDPTLARLHWAIEWHTIAHRQADRWYKFLKAVGLAAGAAIPVITVIGGNALGWKAAVASLGALIVVLEGIQQLKKYGQNALLWAQGKESLKHEYYRFEARIGPSKECSDEEAKRVLAERIEQIIGQEVSKWAEAQAEERSAQKQ